MERTVESNINQLWVSEYCLQKSIGAGAFGFVFSAINEVDSSTCAIKLTFPEYSSQPDEKEKEKKTILREYKIMEGKKHHNIVSVFTLSENQFSASDLESLLANLGMDDKVYDRIGTYIRRANREKYVDAICIRMEICGSNLRQWLNSVTTTPISEIVDLQVDIVQGLIDGVKFLHSNNIMHRDLKPENVMFSINEYDNWYSLPIKIGDFGLCRQFHTGDTITSSLTAGAGTLDYRAPEAYSQDYGPQADLFSLGLVMWEVLQLIKNKERGRLFDSFVNDRNESLIKKHPRVTNCKGVIVNLTKRNVDKRLKHIEEVRLNVVRNFDDYFHIYSTQIVVENNKVLQNFMDLIILLVAPLVMETVEVFENVCMISITEDFNSDEDPQKKLEKYGDSASFLYSWIRQHISIMQDRHFSFSLFEMRKMAAEINRFRVEEVPTRGHDKQRLTQLFREVKKHFRDGEIDRELRIENIERTWQILMLAHQEKDQAIHEEIKKLEKLQRLVEKIHREGKQVEIPLDEIEQRIEEEAKRIDRLHPLDAKHNCDQLERDMQMSEDTIKSMFTDAQTLKDARFHQASEVQKMVQHLHQRWISIRSLLHNRLLSVLASISFPMEEKSVKRTSKSVMETSPVETKTNQNFKVLHEVDDWIKQKQKQLNDLDCGSDLPSVQTELEKQQREQREIEKFQSSVEKCASAKYAFHGDELQLYINYLNTIQKSYSELLKSSRKRLSNLETLMDFIQSATNGLLCMWLSEKLEREITRDWNSKNINVVEVEKYYESLMCEFKQREIQFNLFQGRGESLMLQHHPASKCIETHMSAMQTQWAWLLQLTICLETHLKYVATYQQYFSDIRECEQTVARKEEMLNTIYSKAEFSLDEGEMLLKEMQDMREELTKYGDLIQSVSNQSREIIPLKQRKTNVSRPIIVTAICNFKQNNQQMVINKDERCSLIDNSQRVRWRVTNSSGLEGMVPGVCFMIPPPDKEALDAADRIRRQYDRTVTMWQKKQLKMRQNMIFETLKVVKSWDLSQFLGIGAEHRNAIRKALNEDADKLIQEGDPNDPALRRLRREIDEVNRLFDKFVKAINTGSN